MGRIGITFEEVKEAIAKLQGKQRNPTVDAIREILGTGSKSTIARFLREWKSQHGLCSDDEGRLPSDLLGIVNTLWDAMLDKSEQQVNEYRQTSDTKLIQTQQQLAQAKQLESSLQQTVHKLEEQLQQQTEVIQQLQAKLVQSEQEKIRTTERATSFESRCHESHIENQRLHQLLNHMQENLEHYQEATQQLRQEQSLLMEKQQNEYEQKLSFLLAQSNAVSGEKAIIQAQHDQLTKTYELLDAERKTLAAQYVELQRQHETIKIAYETIQKDYDSLKKQCQIHAQEQITFQHTVLELQLSIKSRDEKIASLEDDIARSANKIANLRHENQFSLQEKANLEGQLKQMQAIMLNHKIQAMS